MHDSMECVDRLYIMRIHIYTMHTTVYSMCICSMSNIYLDLYL